MNTTLKTFEDGSEFKLVHVGVVIAVGMIPAGVIIAKDWMSTSKRFNDFRRKHSLGK